MPKDSIFYNKCSLGVAGLNWVSNIFEGYLASVPKLSINIDNLHSTLLENGNLIWIILSILGFIKNKRELLICLLRLLHDIKQKFTIKQIIIQYNSYQ